MRDEQRSERGTGRETGPRKVFVAPSVLSADFGSLADAVRLVERSGGDFVHLDVMDGCFVPQITFGQKAVTDLRPVSSLPFDTHLMICRPELAIDEFCDAGANHITVHWEAATHMHRILTSIRQKGCRPGIAIIPSTPAEAITEVLPLVDIVLVMTVNPGFGGQELIPRCLRKVETLDRMRRAGGYQFLIEVDGGINRTTLQSALNAGADIVVAGSAFFSAPDHSEEVAFLRGKW
jgi:ribulose-phosphate 3-epimerase